MNDNTACILVLALFLAFVLIDKHLINKKK